MMTALDTLYRRVMTAAGLKPETERVEQSTGDGTVAGDGVVPQ